MHPLLIPLKSIIDQIRKRIRGSRGHVFALDEDLIVAVRKAAKEKGMDETDLLEDIVKAGIPVIRRKSNPLIEQWESLSPREQEVAALLCLGYSTTQIADILIISYDTVRTHCKHIYVKFNLTRKEFRAALKDWDFATWWDNHQPYH